MSSMYPTALTLHSILRWVVLFAGLLAVARACAGWPGRRSWTASDNRAGIWFVAALDLQLLVGLLLYVVLSPLTQMAKDNMAAAMRDPSLRFWAVEHPLGIVVALVLAHVGRVRIRKASTNDRRHRVAAVFFGIALLVILASTPWPGTPNARPLFPW
jgi:hypothetical protein